VIDDNSKYLTTSVAFLFLWHIQKILTETLNISLNPGFHPHMKQLHKGYLDLIPLTSLVIPCKPTRVILCNPMHEVKILYNYLTNSSVTPGTLLLWDVGYLQYFAKAAGFYTCCFYQLRLSMEHHERVSINISPHSEVFVLSSS